MTKSRTAAFALMLAICHSCLLAEELTLGSKAPKLEVQKFIKGEDVEKFEKGKIYVVELWATWCGPCRETIPHLTELQKKHEEVTFIGVAVLEEDPKAVGEFVDEMGKKMDYRVTLDLVPEGGEASEGKVVKNWMEPADLQGIPAAFIINGESKIAWIGHPAEMEEPLAQIVEGKWDLAAEAKKISDAKALLKKIEALQVQLRKLYIKFTEDSQPDELLTALDQAAKDLPNQAIQFQLARFQVLSQVKDRAEDAIATADDLLKSDAGEEWQLLEHLARIIVDPDRDSKADSKLVKLALKLAVKADDLTDKENPGVAHTLAKAYFDNGDFAKAVSTQERVVELAAGTPAAADPDVKKRLKQYKKALDGASAKPKVDGESTKPTKK